MQPKTLRFLENLVRGLCRAWAAMRLVNFVKVAFFECYAKKVEIFVESIFGCLYFQW
jgi:hypothetical protein